MSLENNIKLVEINENKKYILDNLVSLYLHDLSEFADDLKVNEEGKFVYGGLEYYFKIEELTAFFIYYKEEIAGFVLLNRGKYAGGEADYSIHELFVLKPFRKKGVATKAIQKVLEMYKGRYKIEQLEENKLAISFWKSFYKSNNIKYEEKMEVIDDLKCYTQVFNC